MRRFLRITATALLLGGPSLLWAEPPAPELVRSFAKAGLRTERELKTLPDFEAPLTGGGRVSLRDYRGRVVFLNIWATWCGPCRAEMPSMEFLYRRYKDRGLELLALNLQESRREVESFMRDNKLTFPAALDQDGSIGNRYGIRAIPTTFILDRQGRVVLRLAGSVNWNNPDIFAAVETLLNAK
ncbi:MAG: TlpA family protein disulfide reductase [Treponema sp.]|jgi:thiol-disulfide isomerase/thioredoxin|nr:TlpA family protein disulfide reductase [Treponema sp.]